MSAPAPVRMSVMEQVATTPIDHLLHALWEKKGSDLLLVAGAPPTARVDGELEPIEGEEQFTPERLDELVIAMLPPALLQRLREEREIDFSFAWGHHARLRGNAFHQRGSLALALRLIPQEIPTFDDLGVPAIVEQIADAPQGLVLVTGPTGSGKSTTLASMIRHISLRRSCHILTIEDPIEYFHHHTMSLVTQREIGTDSESYPRALRSALREDPDVLLVGEMRDLESIETALTIGETGHLVLATLHTNSAAEAVDRIIDVFGGDRQPQIRSQVASVLVAVVAQQLLPRLGGGRVAAFEVLLGTPATRTLIRQAKTEQLRNVMTTSGKAGMSTFESSLQELVDQGAIAADVAAAAAPRP